MPRILTKPKTDTPDAVKAPTIISRKTHGPDDVKHEPNESIDISTSGKTEAERVCIDIVEPGKMLPKAEEEKFMNEMVEILIEADDDPHAPLFVHSAHNGDVQYIERGKPQRVKRRFLYSLIAAKQAKLVCEFGKDSSGREFNKLAGPKRCTHRVMVLNDTARGRQAYNEWMAQP